MAVSLRLPEQTRRRIEKMAEAHDMTAHAFMVSAIEERLTAEEARAAFHAEAEARAGRFSKTGKGVPAQAMFDYLRKRAAGKPAPRPRARVVRKAGETG